MQSIQDWCLEHADIAGGIIQTPGGDYEITRVIGESTEFEEVRADLRLMASAPRLLRTASAMSRLWSEAPENPCDSLPSSFAEPLHKALTELRAAIDLAEGHLEAHQKSIV